MKNVAAQNLQISDLIVSVSQVLQNIYLCIYLFAEKKSGSFSGPVDDRSGEFPKAASPSCSWHPKAGAQGTRGPPASSHQRGQQALKHEGRRPCGRGQVRPVEMLPVSLGALLFTAAGVLSPARNQSCLSWSLAQDSLNRN